MKLFNGKLTISSSTKVNDHRWAVKAKFVDNTGLYTAHDVKVGNAIYASGTNSAGDNALCAYVVESITSVVGSVTVNMEIEYDEPYANVNEIYAPDVDTEGMICEVSSLTGFAMIANDATKLPQAFIESARNVDMAQRDRKFTIKVSEVVDSQVTSVVESRLGDIPHDDTKYNVAGGTITGDAKVNGELRVQPATGDAAAVLSPTTAEFAISGASPVLKTTVNATGSASPTRTIVASAGIIDTEALNATDAVTKRSTIIGGTSASTQTVVSGVSNGLVSTSVTGDTATLTLSATGQTSGSLNLSAKSTGGGTASITIDTPTTRLMGDGLVSGDFTTVGTITAGKFMQTSSETTFADQQLVTAKYVKDLIGAVTGDSTAIDNLTSQLAAKADKNEVYTKTDVDSLISAIPATSITQDNVHLMVTQAQIDQWNAASTLDFTPENVEHKNTPNGYVGLDEDGKLDPDVLPNTIDQLLLTDDFSTATPGAGVKLAIEKSQATYEGADLAIVNGLFTKATTGFNRAYINANNVLIGWPTPVDEFITNDGAIAANKVMDIDGFAGGDGNWVTVGKNGITLYVEHKTTMDLRGLATKDLTIGDTLTVGEDDQIHIYANNGTMVMPFIRYNIKKRRWEFSNDGETVHAFGDLVVYEDDDDDDNENVDYDMGPVAETAAAHIDNGQVSEADNGEPLDFNTIAGGGL